MSAPIQELFDRVSPYYNRMNDLMSLGLHRLWKKAALSALAVQAGDWVLDLSCGSGDLTLPLCAQVGPQGLVIGGDPSLPMLHIARDRLIDNGFFSEVSFVQTMAESLAFVDHCFDKIVISFGFRNFDDKNQALLELYRILKPGGRLLILEFSKPIPCLAPWLRRYNQHILPLLGEWVAQDRSSYEYLAASIEAHPDQNTVRQLLIEAGFEGCQYRNMSGGIVALHSGYKY